MCALNNLTEYSGPSAPPHFFASRSCTTCLLDLCSTAGNPRSSPTAERIWWGWPAQKWQRRRRAHAWLSHFAPDSTTAWRSIKTTAPGANNAAGRPGLLDARGPSSTAPRTTIPAACCATMRAATHWRDSSGRITHSRWPEPVSAGRTEAEGRAAAPCAAGQARSKARLWPGLASPRFAHRRRCGPHCLPRQPPRPPQRRSLHTPRPGWSAPRRVRTHQGFLRHFRIEDKTNRISNTPPAVLPPVGPSSHGS